MLVLVLLLVLVEEVGFIVVAGVVVFVSQTLATKVTLLGTGCAV